MNTAIGHYGTPGGFGSSNAQPYGIVPIVAAALIAAAAPIVPAAITGLSKIHIGGRKKREAEARAAAKAEKAERKAAAQAAAQMAVAQQTAPASGSAPIIMTIVGVSAALALAYYLLQRRRAR